MAHMLKKGKSQNTTDRAGTLPASVTGSGNNSKRSASGIKNGNNSLMHNQAQHDEHINALREQIKAAQHRHNESNQDFKT
jgi:outer membrane murein-binding lipoprotein Lpp